MMHCRPGIGRFKTETSDLLHWAGTVSLPFKFWPNLPNSSSNGKED